MASATISVCKFVGTISLGLLTGLSTNLTTLTLPALLTLPTAITARSTHAYLTSRSRLLSSYLRHITTFSLFSAYLLSPRRARHPYLLYTSIFTFLSGAGVDYGLALLSSRNTNKEGDGDEWRTIVELEAQGEGVNGEQVRQAVERMRVREGVRAGVAGVAFAMQVVGIWGDGA
ncbi:hypothetical protein K491DRAFT_605417 [Lophiostoma macrostomum CBS 122681]|uniref:DUF1772-domain-containing protein n=1 Tax=Lophiostoma macrostomum CBS 122681 TaxID=1314788 RepID=A0A6A6SYW6_9PLEO|nr:hypothetical protein K491DRAFT_605417 [Lophiostoma macrostomum CBS 122681]